MADRDLPCGQHHDEKHRGAADEIDPVNFLAADQVGNARPENAADHVEHADHQDVGRGESCVHDAGESCAENFRNHRRR